MANREFYQYAWALEKEPVSLWATVNVGGSGAVTLQKWTQPNGSVAGAYSAAPTPGTGYAKGFKGISAITRNSAGNWTLALQDTYIRLLSAHVNFVFTTSGPTAPIWSVISATTNVASATAPQVSFLFQAAAGGAATDPASGEQILIRLLLANSAAL